MIVLMSSLIADAPREAGPRSPGDVGRWLRLAAGWPGGAVGNRPAGAASLAPRRRERAFRWVMFDCFASGPVARELVICACWHLIVSFRFLL
jgi:hypothetical protein